MSIGLYTVIVGQKDWLFSLADVMEIFAADLPELLGTLDRTTRPPSIRFAEVQVSLKEFAEPGVHPCVRIKVTPDANTPDLRAFWHMVMDWFVREGYLFPAYYTYEYGEHGRSNAPKKYTEW